MPPEIFQPGSFLLKSQTTVASHQWFSHNLVSDQQATGKWGLKRCNFKKTKIYALKVGDCCYGHWKPFATVKISSQIGSNKQLVRKAQVEKTCWVTTAVCFNGTHVGPNCRETAVVEDEGNSLRAYPVLWLFCQFVFLQPLYAMREFFCVGKGCTNRNTFTIFHTNLLVKTRPLLHDLHA